MKRSIVIISLHVSQNQGKVIAVNLGHCCGTARSRSSLKNCAFLKLKAGKSIDICKSDLIMFRILFSLITHRPHYNQLQFKKKIRGCRKYKLSNFRSVTRSLNNRFAEINF